MGDDAVNHQVLSQAAKHFVSHLFLPLYLGIELPNADKRVYPRDNFVPICITNAAAK